jgi:hypothetical protein
MAGTVSVAQALEDLFLQAAGTSTGTTDAFNSINGAVTSSGTPRLLSAVGGAAGLTGVGTSTIQMLQKFAGSSSEAAALAGKVANGSAVLGLASNLATLAYQFE